MPVPSLQLTATETVVRTPPPPTGSPGLPGSLESRLSSGTSPPRSTSDVCSISDASLAGRFQFVREIGMGCWGSVWLVRPKKSTSLSSWRSDPVVDRAAIKLVHRTESRSTSSRIRALWSEYKIVKALQAEGHPNIVAVSDFLITPSYAIITMEEHAQVMPIEIGERRARVYCQQIFDAIDFMHRRGYTHNDIKVANILLSNRDKPVLIDFGFASHYTTALSRVPTSKPVQTEHRSLGVTDSSSGLAAKEPFMSVLSWGTPEYLAPERVKNEYHDERLSDVWSAGVTAYEMAVGRTPFERDETEEFLTKDALEEYYERTLSGQIFGERSLSTQFEALIRAMVCADVTKRLRSCRKALCMPFFQPNSHPSPEIDCLVTAKRSAATIEIFKDREPPSLITPPKTPPRPLSQGKENLPPSQSRSDASTSPHPPPTREKAQESPTATSLTSGKCLVLGRPPLQAQGSPLLGGSDDAISPKALSILRSISDLHLTSSLSEINSALNVSPKFVSKGGFGAGGIAEAFSVASTVSPACDSPRHTSLDPGSTRGTADHAEKHQPQIADLPLSQKVTHGDALDKPLGRAIDEPTSTSARKRTSTVSSKLFNPSKRGLGGPRPAPQAVSEHAYSTEEKGLKRVASYLRKLAPR